MFAFVLTGLTIVIFEKCFQLGKDSTQGPQKIHRGLIPRIGGFPIVIAMFSGLVFADEQVVMELGMMLAVAMPAFFAGLLEDVTGVVSAGLRLMASLISGFLFCWFSGYSITSVGIDTVQFLLAMPVVSFLLTTIAIAALINSFNVIDGLNGLSGGTAIIMLSGFAVLAGHAGDAPLVIICFTCLSLIFGFLVWNFPFGKIFLGDGGAYFIGSLVAGVSIILPERNSEISPFTSLLIIIFPLYELLRSTVRRITTVGFKAFDPDNKHFHSLVFNAVVDCTGCQRQIQNSSAAFLTILIPLFCCIWAVMFSDDRTLLIIGVLAFVSIYEIILITLSSIKVTTRDD